MVAGVKLEKALDRWRSTKTPCTLVEPCYVCAEVAEKEAGCKVKFEGTSVSDSDDNAERQRRLDEAKTLNNVSAIDGGHKRKKGGGAKPKSDSPAGLNAENALKLKAEIGLTGRSLIKVLCNLKNCTGLTVVGKKNLIRALSMVENSLDAEMR